MRESLMVKFRGKGIKFLQNDQVYLFPQKTDDLFRGLTYQYYGQLGDGTEIMTIFALWKRIL